VGAGQRATGWAASPDDVPGERLSEEPRSRSALQAGRRSALRPARPSRRRTARRQAWRASSVRKCCVSCTGSVRSRSSALRARSTIHVSRAVDLRLRRKPQIEPKSSRERCRSERYWWNVTHRISLLRYLALL